MVSRVQVDPEDTAFCCSDVLVSLPADDDTSTNNVTITDVFPLCL